MTPVRLAVLGLWLLSGSAAAAVPALVRAVPTAEYKSAVIRADGSTLAVAREGVIHQTAAGSQRYVTRLRGNQRVSFSRSGNCFGVTTYADNAPSTLRAAAFELYDAAGKRSYRLEKPDASEFVVSEDGQWVIGIAGGDEMRQSRLHLFDAQGTLVTSWDVPYLSNLTLPEGSTRFYAATKGVLQAYGFAPGEPHPIGRFEVFGTGGQGRFVALCGAGSVALYDDEKLVFTKTSDIQRPSAMAVSEDGNYIAVAGGNRLEMFDRESGSRLWEVTSGRDELHFVSLDLSGGPDLLLAGLELDLGPDSGPARHTRGAVYLFNRKGELAWLDEFSYNEWSVRYPAVRLVGHQRQFEVELAAEIRRYSLPESP